MPNDAGFVQRARARNLSNSVNFNAAVWQADRCVYVHAVFGETKSQAIGNRD